MKHNRHSLELGLEGQPENKTDLATVRTLLANERTFLAWCRTSLGLMGFGFVLEKFIWYIKHNADIITDRDFHHMGILSMLAFVAGGLIFLTAGVRFFLIQKKIGKGEYKLSSVPELILMASVAGVLAFSTFSSFHIIR